jgi:hypothetical protein
MDFTIHLNDLNHDNYKIDIVKFQKMMMVFNAIEQGWSVKKRDDTYIFTKNHENKKEVFADSYLMKFMKTNLDLNKIFS